MHLACEFGEGLELLIELLVGLSFIRVGCEDFEKERNRAHFGK